MITYSKAKECEQVIPVMLSRLLGLTGKPSPSANFIVGGCTLPGEEHLADLAHFVQKANKDALFSTVILGDEPIHVFSLVERRPGPQIQIHAVVPCRPVRSGPVLLVECESEFAWQLNPRHQLRRVAVPNAALVQAGIRAAQREIDDLINLGPLDGAEWIAINSTPSQG